MSTWINKRDFELTACSISGVGHSKAFEAEGNHLSCVVLLKC